MRVYSFGYKMNGEDQFATTGQNAPLVFDCRNLNNPHNIAHLRQKNGRDQEVQDSVVASPVARRMITEAVNYLIGDPTRSVAFGCSYGKHRSVALAELVKQRLPEAYVIHTGAIAQGKNAR